MGIEEKNREADHYSGSAESVRRLMSFQYQVIAEGAVVGAAAGAAVSVLRLLMHHAEELRGVIIAGTKNNAHGVILALAVLAACCAVACLTIWLVPLASGSGIPQVKGEMHHGFQ